MWKGRDRSPITPRNSAQEGPSSRGQAGPDGYTLTSGSHWIWAAFGKEVCLWAVFRPGGPKEG